MAQTVNELIKQLTKGVAYKLTSGSIPIKIDGKIVEVTPELCGENGDYWCELYIKKEVKMNSIVTVKELHYEVCELDVNRVIALMPKARILIFESAFWTLNEQEDFDKVSELWHKLKGGSV